MGDLTTCYVLHKDTMPHLSSPILLKNLRDRKLKQLIYVLGKQDNARFK